VDENDLGKRDIEIFAVDSRGSRASIGKYHTSITNYVLCVRVRNRDLSNVVELLIEFKGKVTK